MTRLTVFHAVSPFHCCRSVSAAVPDSSSRAFRWPEASRSAVHRT